MARLTPRDIQEKEFNSGFRGYKEEDVDEFLDRVTASYEEVFKENLDIKDEVARLQEENKKYELIGERMQAALVAAQETADDVRKNATKEAENILREAEIKAHKLVQASRDQHRELQKSLAVVKQIEEEFRFKLKSTLQSYLKLLDEVALGDMKEVQKWILPEDMAVLDERRRNLEDNAKPIAQSLKEAPAKVEPAAEPEAEAKEEAEPEAVAAEEPSKEDKKAAEEVAKEREAAKAEADKEAAKAEADKKAAEARKTDEEAKAKAAMLIEEIAAQAAVEEKTEKIKKEETKAEEPPTDKKADADKDVMTAKESPAVKAADSVTEAPAAIVEEPAKSAQKELDKTMPGVEKPPFDVENAKASAVTGEWAKLQEAVAEAVKEVDKPKTKDAEAPKTPDAAIKAEADVSMTDAPKAEAKEPEAKAEPKEKKTGKSKLDDIEIVEDESFWKDI